MSGAAYVGWGVRQLLRKDGCEVEPIPYDIKDYDLIIVGTPVWMFTQDYTASISGNGKIGKATIKAVGKGSYSGTLKTSFVVRPSKTSVKSIRRQKKGLNVNYRKVPGNCSYQVAWHRSGTRRWKRMTRRGDTAVLYDCQPGQRYEVRIRAFKRTASGTYYGKWSETASERA